MPSPGRPGPQAPAGARRFDGRTVVVTGAAGSIGAATARRLADEGARVLVADIDRRATAQLVLDLDGDDRAALVVPGAARFVRDPGVVRLDEREMGRIVGARCALDVLQKWLIPRSAGRACNSARSGRTSAGARGAGWSPGPPAAEARVHSGEVAQRRRPCRFHVHGPVVVHAGVPDRAIRG
ncbi:SDR family NAD(P)-dependent oxidoreductase [Streptomyces pratensis]|uniref:SDR family NAD(P)-dependent oxidoreductase n=1 Tax=Streptomyces pratensis TaxID=1169025 RepID=UPI0037A84064